MSGALSRTARASPGARGTAMFCLSCSRSGVILIFSANKPPNARQKLSESERRIDFSLNPRKRNAESLSVPNRRDISRSNNCWLLETRSSVSDHSSWISPPGIMTAFSSRFIVSSAFPLQLEITGSPLFQSVLIVQPSFFVDFYVIAPGFPLKRVSFFKI